MNTEYLSRLLRIARRTGDSVIVTDPSGENPYVLMPFEKYEALLEGYDQAYDEMEEESELSEFPIEEEVVAEEIPVEKKLPEEFFMEEPVQEPEAPRYEPIPQVESIIEEQEFEGSISEKEGGEEIFYLEPIE